VDRVVLVVCHANVCRSPLAEFLLRDSFAGLGLQVRSAGAHARDGMALCADVAEFIADSSSGPRFASDFRSVRVRPADTGSGMILAASAAEKSALAQLDPTTRRRAFTLREAAMLAEADIHAPAAPAVTAAELAQRWDALRRTGGLTMARNAGDFDIVDAHAGRRPRHEATVAGIVEATTRLSHALARDDASPRSTSLPPATS